MLELRDVPPGARVRMVSGEVREVVDNPRDGLWLVTRPVPAEPHGEDGADEDGADEVDDTWAYDVSEVLE